MTTWNYRVVCVTTVTNGKKYNSLGIHSVYYNDAGVIDGYSADSAAPSGATLEELHKDLQHMLNALRKPIVYVTNNSSPAG